MAGRVGTDLQGWAFHGRGRLREWAVVFDDEENDARVYVRCDAEVGETWLLTAPNLGMFFWDLAQTGLAYFQDTKVKGGKPVRRSDIGLALDL